MNILQNYDVQKNLPANPLNSLMKKKYGLTTHSNLTITDKDTLYTSFRKVARYIDKNGDWSEQDYINSAKSLLEDTGRVDQVKSIVRTSTPKLSTSLTRGKDVFEMNVVTEGKENKEYFVVDPDNKSGSTQTRRYLDTRTYQNFYSGNQNLTNGYGRLVHDVLQSWYEADPKYHEEIKPEDFKGYLFRLTSAYYSGKKHVWVFEKDPLGDLSREELFKVTDPNPDSERSRIWKPDFIKAHPELNYSDRVSFYTWQRARRSNLMSEFCSQYLANTYNLVRQQRYLDDIDKQTHAKAWQTKKHINKATQAIMQQTQLNKTFSKVEIDNDVDLKLFSDFENEVGRLTKVLPKGTQPAELRLRKLGNHKAKGLFVPFTNTIVVDFRKPSEIYQNAIGAVETPGYASFVHEYGHYLDFNHSDKEKIPLSLSGDFQKLLKEYQTNLKDYPLTDKEKSYYGTPTEVFARAFELYAHDAGLTGNLIGREQEYNAETGVVPYRAFTPAMREEITYYFDQLPLTKDLRKSLNMDTSIEKKTRHFVMADDKFNDPRLMKEPEKLSQLAVKALDKWTSDPDSMELLINKSGTTLNMKNANRVLAVDKWQEKMPEHLVTSDELLKAGVPVKKYPKASWITGFVQNEDNHRYYPKKLFNVDDLQKETWNNLQDYLKITKSFTNQKENNLYVNYEINSEVLNKVIPDKLGATPEDKLANRIGRWILKDGSISLEERDKHVGFRFTKAERDLFTHLTNTQKHQVYLSGVNQAHEHQKNLARMLNQQREHNRQPKAAQRQVKTTGISMPKAKGRER